ncbi:MAG: SMP-30/gluconolactonase/LRE family protein [Acholeplasmatales bacterium]|nr:SMP-30/gluconolactonase/LRE family protein [Acholeplasmatales bacterium]
MSWIDIVGKKLFILDKNKELKEVLFNEKIGAAIPIKDSNGFLVFGETKVFLYQNDEIKEYKDISSIVSKGMRCNDAKADRKGRIWFSTIVDDGISKPHGGLYTIIDDKIICMQETKLGNGLAWNKDNTKFYFSDSIEHKVFIYDYDINTGLISNRRVLAETDGIPDGMTIDDNDNLFIAIWGGNRIEVRDSISGKILDIINIPTKLVTSCTFSGENYDELIITTASLSELDEYAGKVFKLKVKYKGLPESFVKIK